MNGLSSFVHVSVLLEETVEGMAPRDGGRYVDCTLGGGGHAQRILEASAPSGRLLALDQDEAAIAHAGERLKPYGDRVILVQENFRHVRRCVERAQFGPVDGVVFDLGVSSPQFDEPERGFSYRHDAALDMRMDRRQTLTAADLVNEASEEELARIFFEYGEEKFSRRVARAIVRRREMGRIETTGELAEIVREAIPAPARRSGPHPARRVFQALRIAVNDELGALREGLEGAFAVLAPGGRLAVITFHSLEDRLVKKRFAEWCQGCVCPPDFPVCTCGRTAQARLVTRKPIVPSEAEVADNPRARSAKLRILERL
ncbi:MAG: 16S rRNA (cytosine(1402)-N(4))-methyltransferase RsmH [Alicyclobacillus macrosporangiidus]|uniref:16S rRNA (cytosine(1402)-N(4))-methyltransferase RsmH n=1 Tax=Alicyclobacillus macrosporangiidus TaxID=392015 RepID=UPI0026F0915C|nr:16S rRNA (cytosine(1402)-N(4))-methyltransferase RsmH [Alicyclobacillus macrosporangiidus]MCL6599056.1 16S rRNA (cytosine(1402)-N(4))-methyltransferase RsmH [Alicyclobacillus macrosporangiidus]